LLCSSRRACLGDLETGRSRCREQANFTLTLINLASGRFSTKATAARSFAGKFVLVQRLSSTGVATLKKVTLDAGSSATFRVRLRDGRSRLRVVMPTWQTAPGYITGLSKVLTVSR
jgi:hypothetical protein